ncbi:MAG: type II toxin-antitoxin system prevent-host-death family antitoxin [Stellaceae bacterium]
MKRISATEARRHLSQLLAAVMAGDPVVITKRGRPVAIVSPHPGELTPAEREAAIAHLAAVMDEPVILQRKFRTFSRDEMHER